MYSSHYKSQSYSLEESGGAYFLGRVHDLLPHAGYLESKFRNGTKECIGDAHDTTIPSQSPTSSWTWLGSRVVQTQAHEASAGHKGPRRPVFSLSFYLPTEMFVCYRTQWYELLLPVRVILSCRKSKQTFKPRSVVCI